MRREPATREEAWVQERLQWENWERLWKQTVDYAKGQTRRWHSRGSREGVLPEGQDGESVAGEAIAQMLAGKCRLALGWTGQRLERELERLVKQEISRLHARQEAARTRSEWEVLPAGEDGKPRSILERMAGESAVGYDEAAERERTRRGLAPCLDGDETALGVLGCLCAGVSKRGEIAAKLGVDARAVTAARKRLERKARRWRLIPVFNLRRSRSRTRTTRTNRQDTAHPVVQRGKEATCIRPKPQAGWLES